MSELWSWIKEHPYIAGGGIVGIIGLLFLVTRGGSSTPVQAQPATATQDASQLAASGIDPSTGQPISLEAAATAAGNAAQLAALQATQNTQLATTQANASATADSTAQQIAALQVAQNENSSNNALAIAQGGLSTLDYLANQSISADTQAEQAATSQTSLLNANLYTGQLSNAGLSQISTGAGAGTGSGTTSLAQSVANTNLQTTTFANQVGVSNNNLVTTYGQLLAQLAQAVH